MTSSVEVSTADIEPLTSHACVRFCSHSEMGKRGCPARAAGMSQETGAASVSGPTRQPPGG